MAVAMSGWMEAYDGEATKMAQLWVDQQNAKGGLLGKPIKVISGDTKTDRVGAPRSDKLSSSRAPTCFWSPRTTTTERRPPSGPESWRHFGVHGRVGSKAGVIGVGPLSFTANNAGQLEGACHGDWGMKKKGVKKGYMLIDETIEYNKSVCAGYDWQMKVNKGTVAGKDTFKGLDPTISSQITRLNEAISKDGVDHIMLCSTNPGAASSLRQLRVAGVNLPVFRATAMDGTYWLNSVTGLKDFYLPSQALAKDDPRPAVNEISAAYEKKFNKPPTTQYAYPIYAFLDMWAKAVTEAKTADAKPVVDILNKANNQQTVLGPRTFTPKLHVQTTEPMFVMSYADGKETPVEEWKITETIPDACSTASKAASNASRFRAPSRWRRRPALHPARGRRFGWMSFLPRWR
jgi:branched-chain amino acid transport system substrate-binding protein